MYTTFLQAFLQEQMLYNFHIKRLINNMVFKYSRTLWTAQIFSTNGMSHFSTKNYHVIYKKSLSILTKPSY